MYIGNYVVVFMKQLGNMGRKKAGIGQLWICIVFVISLLVGAGKANAQIELSSGIDMNYALLFNQNNSQINYGQLGFGLRFGLSYKPNEQFFPTLNFAFGRTRLPLKQFGTDNNVAAVNINYMNLLLNGNFVLAFNNDNALYVIGGIGFASLKNAGLSISGKNSGAMKIHQDSVAEPTRIFPSVSLGLEYAYGVTSDQKIYMSVGLSVQYIYLFPDRNIYHMTVVDNKGTIMPMQAELMGRPFIPNFNITLHYMMGKSLIFWKKRDSRYL